MVTSIPPLASIGSASPSATTTTFAGRTVTRIGYGALQLTRLKDEPGAAVALLKRAIELGVDHIDTAQFYGDGLVNHFLSTALSPNHQVTIVTKVGFDPNPVGPMPMRAAQRPEQLRASVEANLLSLGSDHIRVVNLRRLDGPHQIPVPSDQVIGLDDQIAEMTAMRDEGIIGAFGLSAVNIEGLRQALPAGIACVQNAYSLIARDDEEILKLCITEQVPWMPYFPLGSAFPGMPKVTDEAAVQEIAHTLGVTASQVGLAWLLHHTPNTLLIPGTTSTHHLEVNMAASLVQLDAVTLATLDAIPSFAARPISEH